MSNLLILISVDKTVDKTGLCVCDSPVRL